MRCRRGRSWIALARSVAALSLMSPLMPSAPGRRRLPRWRLPTSCANGSMRRRTASMSELPFAQARLNQLPERFAPFPGAGWFGTIADGTPRTSSPAGTFQKTSSTKPLSCSRHRTLAAAAEQASEILESSSSPPRRLTWRGPAPSAASGNSITPLAALSPLEKEPQLHRVPVSLELTPSTQQQSRRRRCRCRAPTTRRRNPQPFSP